MKDGHHVTVLGVAHARVGAEFTYRGETDEACAPCRLRKACQNLAPHHAYRVTAVREKEHDVCSVFEGNVKIVEVEERPLRVVVPASAARGTAFTNRFEECGASCLLKSLCNPPALPKGASAALLSVEGRVSCLVGRDLRFASVTAG